MAWTQVTTDYLKKVLSKTEYDALDNLSKDPEQTTILSDIISYWVNAWRNQLKKNGPIDNRAGYVADSIIVYLLAQVRYQAWTRMPNSRAPGLDDRRADEYDRANSVFDNITKYSTDIPDDEYVDVPNAGATSPYIVVPLQYLD